MITVTLLNYMNNYDTLFTPRAINKCYFSSNSLDNSSYSTYKNNKNDDNIYNCENVNLDANSSIKTTSRYNLFSIINHNNNNSKFILNNKQIENYKKDFSYVANKLKKIIYNNSETDSPRRPL